MIAALLFTGFVFQLYVNLVAGAAFLLAGTLLGIVKGYSNIPDNLSGPREWRGAERKQLENVLAIANKSRRWDHSLLDVSCWMGMLTFLAIAGTTVWLAYLLFDAGYDWLALAWGVGCGCSAGPALGHRRTASPDQRPPGGEDPGTSADRNAVGIGSA